MSKLYPGSAPPLLAPDQQLGIMPGACNPVYIPRRSRGFKRVWANWNLDFSEQEISIIAALDNPRRCPMVSGQ